MQKPNSGMKQIVDVKKRSNTKCKRKKNLLKKCYQLGILCNLDIHVTIHDKERKQIDLYTTRDEFNIDHIKKLLSPRKNSKANNYGLKSTISNFQTLFKNTKMNECDSLGDI